MIKIKEEEIDDILKQIVEIKGIDYLMKKYMDFTESELRDKRNKEQIVIKKYKESFESFSKKVYDGFDKKTQSDLSKFRRVRRDVIKWENEISNYKSKIKERREKINRYYKILNKLYGRINHLKSDYIPIVNVVSYKKDVSIYWNINVKFKNYIKSIYLGSDKKLREIFNEKIGLRKNISKEKFRQKIEFCLVEEVMDLVIENKDDYDNWNIKKEELWKFIK